LTIRSKKLGNSEYFWWGTGNPGAAAITPR
jgi:hypothetical protein